MRSWGKSFFVDQKIFSTVLRLDSHSELLPQLSTSPLALAVADGAMRNLYLASSFTLKMSSQTEVDAFPCENSASEGKSSYEIEVP